MQSFLCEIVNVSQRTIFGTDLKNENQCLILIIHFEHWKVQEDIFIYLTSELLLSQID